MLNLSPDTRRKFLRTELLICFIPLTLWFVSTLGGIIYLQFSPDYADDFMKGFSIAVSNIGLIKAVLIMLSPLIIGPLGLVLVLLVVVKHKHFSFWWPLLGLLLCMPMTNAVLSAVARNISDGLFFTRWRDMVIFIFPMTLFPIIGFIQLFILAHQNMDSAISVTDNNISL